MNSNSKLMKQNKCCTFSWRRKKFQSSINSLKFGTCWFFHSFSLHTAAFFSHTNQVRTSVASNDVVSAAQGRTSSRFSSHCGRRWTELLCVRVQLHVCLCCHAYKWEWVSPSHLTLKPVYNHLNSLSGKKLKLFLVKCDFYHLCL